MSKIDCSSLHDVVSFGIQAILIMDAAQTPKGRNLAHCFVTQEKDGNWSESVELAVNIACVCCTGRMLVLAGSLLVKDAPQLQKKAQFFPNVWMSSNICKVTGW